MNDFRPPKGTLVTESSRRKQLVDVSTVPSEVVRRVHHRPKDGAAQQQEDNEPPLTTDAREILSKKPEPRLKWTQKAFAKVCKGTLKPSVVYDIVTHPKFIVGFNTLKGRELKTLVFSHMDYFSAKQKKFLLSSASKLNAFVGADYEGGEDKPGSGSEVEDEKEGAEEVEVAKVVVAEAILQQEVVGGWTVTETSEEVITARQKTKLNFVRTKKNEELLNNVFERVGGVEQVGGAVSSAVPARRALPPGGGGFGGGESGEGRDFATHSDEAHADAQGRRRRRGTSRSPSQPRPGGGRTWRGSNDDGDLRRRHRRRRSSGSRSRSRSGGGGRSFAASGNLGAEVVNIHGVVVPILPRRVSTGGLFGERDLLGQGRSGMRDLLFKDRAAGGGGRSRSRRRRR